LGFLTGLFGGENTYITFALALGIVLVLILLVVWGLKVLTQATGNVGRGRNRRLMIVDAIPLDQKRHAMLIRRDDIEHLIITGGPQDIVVESGIEVPPATPARPRRAAEPQTKAQPAPKDDAAAEEPSSRLAKLKQATQPKPTSLRHTGLLRAVDKPETSQPVGNGHIRDASYPDSVTNGSGPRTEVKGPASSEVDLGDGDSAGKGASQLRQRSEPAN
jgi:flagellar protein FliO/FliZ